MTPEDWSSAIAPDIAAFGVIAERAFGALPQPFQDLCRSVVIRIADFPDEETMTAMRCETEFDLLGLFHGIGLAHAGAVEETGQAPNLVWLYRRPILDYWAEHEESLGHIITHVLIHELGHHLGLSDDDMEAIEAAAGD